MTSVSYQIHLVLGLGDSLPHSMYQVTEHDAQASAEPLVASKALRWFPNLDTMSNKVARLVYSKDRKRDREGKRKRRLRAGRQVVYSPASAAPPPP